jgi:hypothetical protein
LCGLTPVAGASQAEEDYDFQRIRTRNSVFSESSGVGRKVSRRDAVEQVGSAPISPGSNNRASCRADIDQTSNGSRISAAVIALVRVGSRMCTRKNQRISPVALSSNDHP